MGFYYYFRNYPISAHCYRRAEKETELMNEEIKKQLGLEPCDKDVVVLYDGEKGNQVRSFPLYLQVESQGPHLK